MSLDDELGSRPVRVKQLSVAVDPTSSQTGGHLEQAERDGVAALFASRVISRAVEDSGGSESPGAQCS